MNGGSVLMRLGGGPLQLKKAQSSDLGRLKKRGSFPAIGRASPPRPAPPKANALCAPLSRGVPWTNMLQKLSQNLLRLAKRSANFQPPGNPVPSTDLAARIISHLEAAGYARAEPAILQPASI